MKLGEVMVAQCLGVAAGIVIILVLWAAAGLCSRASHRVYLAGKAAARHTEEGV